MFRITHLLTPVAIIRFAERTGPSTYRFTREVFIFGIRVSYWTVGETNTWG